MHTCACAQQILAYITLATDTKSSKKKNQQGQKYIHEATHANRTPSHACLTHSLSLCLSRFLALSLALSLSLSLSLSVVSNDLLICFPCEEMKM